MPSPKVPQRVTLLYRGMRPGVELLALLGEDRAVNVIKAPLELSRGEPPADVVIVDVPAEDRRAVCEQVRHHYRGPLIVLLHPGDNSHDLPPDRSRTLLTRPFSLRELVVAVAASVPAPPASDSAGRLGLLLPHGAQDRRANPDWDNGRSTVAQAVPRPGRSWRERRLVRVLAILVPAALAFIAAFGLLDQSDRCPPRCDELTGADDLTSPSGTTVQAVGVGPETIDSGVGVAGPTTTGPSVGRTAVDGSRTDAPTSGATRISTTTPRSGRLPGTTSPPDPTRPQPSASS
ncbi:MAG: hypothetical protein M3460_31005, partial [Actinomycetota bacterium]|nr:hypothetical protein [Actinomycetota bacterium]